MGGESEHKKVTGTVGTVRSFILGKAKKIFMILVF
jgi:hypothetical protein